MQYSTQSLNSVPIVDLTDIDCECSYGRCSVCGSPRFPTWAEFINESGGITSVMGIRCQCSSIKCGIKRPS